MKLHQPSELIQDAQTALRMLKEGNDRFVKNQLCDKSTYTSDREVFKCGQKPFAVVVCCADSRVVPEIFFDQRLGDIIVVRNAGNVVDKTVLGTIEYSVQYLGSPLVVVCGHSQCGAITATYKGDLLPQNLQSVAQYIQPAVDQGGDIHTVTHIHVENMVAQVRLNTVVQAKETMVIGSYYDIHTGIVSWL